jgi:hypothetical protein
LLALLGALPLTSWIAGGEFDRAYARRLSEWGYGTAICLGIAIVVWVLAKQRTAPHAARRDAPTAGQEARLALAISAASAVLYAVIARVVFDGRPLLIDEIVQVFQAQIYASGHLSLPVSAHPEFFSMLHVVDTGSRMYSQFPPGGPAFLALGVLAGAPWLVGPVAGALSVWLFSRLLRYTDPERSAWWRLGASAVFAVAPFGAFMFGSHMNHATTLLALLVATYGLARATSTAATAPGWGFIAGLGLGVAATIRPLDALAFAGPAALWLGWRALRTRTGMPAFVASGVGVALPFAAMAWVNTRTTGAPFLFGYEVLWGASHGLGFHASPWGEAHTPARGVELISLYVTRLQTYLFETPFPSLLPAIAGLALAPRHLRPLDRYLLASASLLGALYFAYWHDGFFLGPRFVFAWLPVLVLWSARAPGLVLDRVRASARPRAAATLGAFLVTGALLAVTASLPVRLAQYRGGLTSMRVDYGAAARAAGATNALVFVRESWGSQIVTRLWARGVSRSATAALYAGVDACALDRALRELERTDTQGTAAEGALTPLLADSAKVRSSPLSPDSTEKVLPGATYDAPCLAGIQADRSGYTHLVPLALERTSGNVYVRDFGARDSLMLAAYPDRPVWQLRRHGMDGDPVFVWERIARDSALAAWRAAPR